MFGLVKTKECPLCKAVPVEYKLKQDWEGKITRHCNGQHWESVKFACGLVIEWIPNFGKEQFCSYSECKNDPEIKAALKAKDNLIDRMVAMIKADEKVDAETKDNLIQSFSWKRSRN